MVQEYSVARRRGRQNRGVWYNIIWDMYRAMGKVEHSIASLDLPLATIFTSEGVKESPYLQESTYKIFGALWCWVFIYSEVFEDMW